MKTLIAAALLLAFTAPACSEAVPQYRPHLDVKHYEAQKKRLSGSEQLSLKICLYGWEELSEQELKAQNLPGSIHCKIAAKALKKHHINLRDTFQ